MPTMISLGQKTAKKRCSWVNVNEALYCAYHDNEWGVPIYDQRLLFEFINLEGMQAGLSWITILKKRENYRDRFANFDAEKISRFTRQKMESLLKDPGIIRNRLKVEAIINNAKALLNLQQKDINFSDFIWEVVDGEPIINHWKTSKSVPTSTNISDQLAKRLKQVGFKFVGTTICYAFMQAVGLVNDHTINCYRHREMMTLK